MSLNGLECQASKSVNSDTRPRPMTQNLAVQRETLSRSKDRIMTADENLRSARAPHSLAQRDTVILHCN